MDEQQIRQDERERLAKILEKRVRWVACDCGCEMQKIADQNSGVWLRAAMLVRDGMVE
jgi:hypothetical protein